ILEKGTPVARPVRKAADLPGDCRAADHETVIVHRQSGGCTMNVSTRWLTRAAAGAALLLGACADQTNSPVAPEAPVPTLRTVAIASTGVEQIYLSDTREGGGEDGSVLYGVELDDVAGVANLTALVDLNVRPYNGLFDRAHIAATPDGSLVYLINRDPVPSAGGNPVAT